jgi:two-component system cell cycle sensor histidine kinase/response regulator CckA
MTSPVVLVILDNPITRTMLRVALEAEGYEVAEAEDGRSALQAATARRPAFAILDDVLRDTDGRTLLAEIRKRTDRKDLPALVVTSLLSRLEEFRSQSGWDVQYLPKPVEPSRVIEVVRTHLSTPAIRGSGQRLLVVDDEPLNLRLAQVRLRRAGYEVETASGGEEALKKARENPPDAILADVLMPAMDGYTFCREARRDPRLEAVPVVLVSSADADDADRDLARTMGASALVARTPDARDVTAVLKETLRKGPPPAPPRRAAAAAIHRERLQIQGEHQAARNEAVRRQAAIQATAVSLMNGLAEALSRPEDLAKVTGGVLVHSLDAAGLPMGLFYLVEPNGRPHLQAQCGIPAESRADAEASFGHSELLRRIVESGEPLAFSSTTPGPGVESRAFLTRLGHSSALVVPLVVLGRGFGVLVLASDTPELAESAWIGFARCLALQFDQTVALGQSLTRLAASEARYRALMEQANDAILILDLPHRILEANREAERLLGRPRQQIVGRHYDDFVVPQERADSARREETLLADGAVRVETRQFVRPDGSQVPVEVSASVVRTEEGAAEPVVLAILRDITERRRAEETLRRSEARMKSILDAALDAVIGMDAHGRVVSWNSRAAAIFGWSPEEALGRAVSDLIIPPGSREDHLRGLARFLATGEGPMIGRRIELDALRRDGSEFPVELTVTALREGDATLFSAFVADLSEKKRLEGQLLQSQKTESVGRLAGGVAHDFNNLLGVITGYAELLGKRLPDDPRLQRYLDDILKAAHRAAGLTQQLLAFSRKQVLQPRILDLNDVVLETEKMLRRLIGEDIEFVSVLRDRLGCVRADRGQIEQVLMNLAVNARDAMGRGGRLTIETANVDLDATYVRLHPGVDAGPYVMLAVSDTGHGMDQDVMGHLFEPFFTTKEAGKGTGLGLATVHGIVKQSGGHIFVYSETDRGTAFKIYLPRLEASEEAVETAPARTEVPRGFETVLLVEDEASLRALVRECLEGSGYTVLEARHAMEALEIVERTAPPIHLLMTDVVMPQMSGRELAERLAAPHPEIKVLYMSGYTDDAVVRHGVLSEDMPFLQKPFTGEALARKVRTVLDEA